MGVVGDAGGALNPSLRDILTGKLEGSIADFRKFTRDGIYLRIDGLGG
jgi:hypothetical protein